jgi:two-component system phosphate regulon sensor histidine kinase PhoR
VPISGKTKPLGVLHLYDTCPSRFSPDDATLATTIARQAGVALESMQVCADLETEAQARAQFVQMVTHELRSPVAGSQVLLKTMTCGLAGDLNEQQLDVLKRIDARLATLREMVEDLLDLAATKTVDLNEPVGRLPLQPVLTSVVNRLAPEAETKELHLEVDIPFEVLTVRATETGMKRILENLIGNAIKYTPPGGSVKVCVVERPGGVVIMISDTGIGIPPEDLPRLWRDFYRASNARESGIPGTGLGLSIVRQFVDHFGGMISVQSVVGEGTTFKVTLPAATAADDVVPVQAGILSL